MKILGGDDDYSWFFMYRESTEEIIKEGICTNSAEKQEITKEGGIHRYAQPI